MQFMFMVHINCNVLEKFDLDNRLLKFTHLPPILAMGLWDVNILKGEG